MKSEAVIEEEMVNKNMGFDHILKHVKFETFYKVAIGVLMLFVSVAFFIFWDSLKAEECPENLDYLGITIVRVDVIC